MCIDTNLPRRKGATILLVEDDSHLAGVLSMLLERKGHKVLAFYEGSQALAIYLQRAKEIDLLITDIVMPGMSGIELVRSLKEINSELKVIASSGHVNQPVEDALKTLGVSRILRKPYNVMSLIGMVDDAIFGNPQLKYEKAEN